MTDVCLQSTTHSARVTLAEEIDAHLFRQVLARFGVEMSHGSPSVPALPQASNAGAFVVGIGGASAWAACYASAVSRPLISFPRLEELLCWVEEKRVSSVFVWLPQDACSFAVVNRLMEVGGRRNLRLGILPLPNTLHQATAVTARLVGLRLAPKPYPHRTVLYCDFVEDAPDALSQCAGTQQVEDFLRWSQEGADALVFHGHGNGADFRLGNSAICVQVDLGRPRGDNARRVLPCQVGGRCRLGHKTNLRAFFGSSVMQASCVVLLSCWGFSPTDGLIDPEFTLTSALLRGDCVEAVLTSTRINYTTPGVAVAAARFLDGGGTLGELALCINGFDDALTPAYVCVGDPESRVRQAAVAKARESSGSAQTRTRTRTRTRGPESSGHQPGSLALALALAKVQAMSFVADWLSELQDAGDTVEALRAEVASLLDKSDKADKSTGAALTDTRLGQAFAACIGAKGISGLHELWRPRAALRSQADLGVAACSLCSLEAKERHYVSTVYRGYARIVRSCPVHGVVEDRPEHLRLPRVAVQRLGGEVHLSLSGDKTDAQCAFAAMEGVMEGVMQGAMQGVMEGISKREWIPLHTNGPAVVVPWTAGDRTMIALLFAGGGDVATLRVASGEGRAA